MKIRGYFLAIFLVGVFVALSQSIDIPPIDEHQNNQELKTDEKHIINNISNLELPFIENQGQIKSDDV